ncbi:MAG: hypothetical protein OXB86_03585, partial [Bdellovibrionales bacterium]|nr:hypothetical protein [Bdellovibrionales bacterium]
ISDADAAIATADEAKTDDEAAAEDADAKNAAKEKAGEAKKAAKAAEEKAKGCAGGEASGSADAEACENSTTDHYCTKYGSSGVASRVVLQQEKDGDACNWKAGYFHIFENVGGSDVKTNTEKDEDVCDSKEDCAAKAEAWVEAQTDAGYTCS